MTTDKDTTIAAQSARLGVLEKALGEVLGMFKESGRLSYANGSPDKVSYCIWHGISGEKFEEWKAALTSTPAGQSGECVSVRLDDARRVLLPEHAPLTDTEWRIHNEANARLQSAVRALLKAARQEGEGT